jgi:hypothetical protein
MRSYYIICFHGRETLCLTVREQDGIAYLYLIETKQQEAGRCGWHQLRDVSHCLFFVCSLFNDAVAC